MHYLKLWHRVFSNFFFLFFPPLLLSRWCLMGAKMWPCAVVLEYITYGGKGALCVWQRPLLGLICVMWINGSLECGRRPKYYPQPTSTTRDDIPAALYHPPGCAENQMKWSCHLNLFYLSYENLWKEAICLQLPLLPDWTAYGLISHVQPEFELWKRIRSSRFLSSCQKYAILGACYLSLSQTGLCLLFLPETI